MILNNMSEATRLEQSLSQAELDEFALNKVIAGVMQGYQFTYPEQTFNLNLSDQQMPMQGVPEYIAQLMDKLIANAIEFSPKESAIAVDLSASSKQAIITVSNHGPALPSDMGEQIFESMVSVRSQKPKKSRT